MATPDLTATQVMTAVNAALNDQGGQVYTESVQIPYLNMASQELKEEFQLNEVPVVATHSAIINVPAGQSKMMFSATAPVPELPNDLIELKQVWESPEGLEQWIPMTKVEILPRWMEGQEYQQFIYYVWQSQEIRFLPSNQDNDIKLDYIKELFPEITDGDDEIGIINAKGYLTYKTAALIALLVEENEPRAMRLDQLAVQSLNRVTGIGSKGRQNIMIRRRPFRQGYKRGNIVR